MSAKRENKPKPVDIAYSCVGVADQHEGDNAVPVILIHGFSMNKDTWMGMDEEIALRTNKRVYIIDLRNHGESPWSNECDVEAMTEDVIHLMDKLKISKAIVFGHSLGGKMAVHLALNYPSRIEKIIVEDMRPNGMTPESLEEVHTYMSIYKEVENAFEQGISEKEGIDMLTSLLVDQVNKMNQPEMIKADTKLLPMKIRDGKCQWKFNPMLITLALNDFMAILNESIGLFEGPTLFIYGAESNFKVDEEETNIKKLFPNATTFGVKGATHCVHFFPEFVDVVIKFINKN